MTIPYAEVIGDPISHSKSPLLHKFWLKKLGINADYRSARVSAQDLAAYFDERRRDSSWRGANVTIPHKEPAFRLVDRLEPSAQGIGALNIVVARDELLVGDNSDIYGIHDALSEKPLSGASICLIGAGGAARAALHVFAEAGVREVSIVTRSAERGYSLLEAFELSGGSYPLENCETAFAGIDVIVNASPLGMVGQPPMPNTIIKHLKLSADLDTFVFDMVYTPLETSLLKAARDLGMVTVDGLTMLIGQAAGSFNLFYGSPASREHDAEVRALLTS